MSSVKIKEIVWAFFITMAIIFGLYGLAALIAPPKAEADTGILDVCAIFDDYGPTLDMVMGIGEYLINERGMSGDDAGQYVRSEVSVNCPWYSDDLTRAGEEYERQSRGVVVR